MGWSATLWLLAAATLCSGVHEYLLPTDVLPRHYDLKLLFDIDPASQFSFYGVVDILLTPQKSVSKIVLHADGFNISVDRISLIVDGGSERIDIFSVDLYNTHNFLTINLQYELEENRNYSLVIPFYGKLKEVLNGAYISHYLDKTTQMKQYLVVTYFEAISARNAFPCFDEPLFKATYTIHIGHRKDYTAVSNMPVATITTDNALESYWPWNKVKETFNKDISTFVWTEFERSVLMSTYLVAFLVSNFVYVKSPLGLSTTRFKIWAEKNAISQTEYASVIAPKILSYYEKWFNISFPLPKLDMVAITDFVAGGMENWGLLTYRDTILLYNRQESSLTAKENIAEIVAHEIVHQWFGNLVTMKWWSDVWIKEGFAMFLQSFGVNAVEPSWNYGSYHSVNNILFVLKYDALESSHPLSVPIIDPKTIMEIFDSISYRKGSVLVRMMTMFLGEDIFKKTINKYLLKYSYSNVEQDDLWHELTVAVQQYGGLSRNITVKQIMDTWTTQTGYPILNVNRDYTEGTVAVTQKRYLSLGNEALTTVSWWIPLDVQYRKDVTESHQPVQWLAVNEGVDGDHKFSHKAKANEWLIFNKDYIAPCRVNYDERNWQMIIQSLNSPNMSDIPTLSRVQVVTDAFELAWTNRLDYSIALQLSRYLQQETEYLPLEAGLAGLERIENVLIRSSDYGSYQNFVRILITDTYKRSGGMAIKKIINENDMASVKMQVMMSSWACRLKVPGCENNAIDMFQQWMETENPDENNPIPPDLRRTVYCVAISRGDASHWRFLFARQQRANVALMADMQQGLTCTREVWILSQYLEWTVSDVSNVHARGALDVIASVVRTTVGYYVAKDFIYNRIENIYYKVKAVSLIDWIIIPFIEQFTTNEELDEFLKWRDKNAKYLIDLKSLINQAIETSKLNIGWMVKNRRNVIDQMKQFSTDHKESSEMLRSLRNKADRKYFNKLYSIMFLLLNIRNDL